MEKLVVFSGAGMSAESGLKTFRDNGGLWENHDVHEVATPEAWARNPDMVLRFYNERRKQLLKAVPNGAHQTVAKLENHYDVTVVTQNIDNLHERAGSKNVMHLHGELMKARSQSNPNYRVVLEKATMDSNDRCPEGLQLRPDVVWFGEPVPMIEVASKVISLADILIVIGTSLNVYPAAGLVFEASRNCKKIVIDPKSNDLQLGADWLFINEKAEKGMNLIFQSIKKGGLHRLFES